MKFPIDAELTNSFRRITKRCKCHEETRTQARKCGKKPLKKAENPIFTVDIVLWISYDTKESIIVYVNFAQLCPSRMQETVLLLFFNYLCNRF